MWRRSECARIVILRGREDKSASADRQRVKGTVDPKVAVRRWRR